MDRENYTVTAAQGSQPTVGMLTVGIIDVARFNGVSKARLLLRPTTGDKAVTVTEGDSLEVLGHGLLTLKEVIVEGKGGVTLSLDPSILFTE